MSKPASVMIRETEYRALRGALLSLLSTHAHRSDADLRELDEYGLAVQVQASEIIRARRALSMGASKRRLPQPDGSER